MRECRIAPGAAGAWRAAEPDVRFETKHGAADFAIGDRVQFTDTDKLAHIHNGNAGTITKRVGSGPVRRNDGCLHPFRAKMLLSER